MAQLILIRTDASIKIGSGHVMRCLSLAELLRDSGATIEFITRDHPGNLNQYIHAKGFKVHLLPAGVESDLQQALSGYEQWLGVKQEADAEVTIQALESIQADWMIVDHYALDENWEEKLRLHVNRIMVIDDLANRRHDCDLLLDQNYIHNQNRYDTLISPGATRLLGPEFALLKKAFAESHQSSKRKYETINRVFVFFGGSDPDNLTSTALKVLARPNLKHLTVDVVVGAANLNLEEVKALVLENPNAHLHVQVENIAELMCDADIALGAGGTTTWERMALGLPSIVVTVAENQIAFTRDLEQDDYLKWLGSADQVDDLKLYNTFVETINNPCGLREQSRKGLKLVDGKGVERVVKLITAGPDTESLVARRAEASDCLLYWYWANDRVVRENAFNEQAIEWENHCAWFDKRLNDSDTVLVLIECVYGPLGQVRFDRSGSCYTIGYSIVKQFRKFGLGKEMLGKAIDYLRREGPFTLIGDVKRTNQASIKVFEQLGFKKTTLLQNDAYRFLLECSRSNIL